MAALSEVLNMVISYVLVPEMTRYVLCTPSSEASQSGAYSCVMVGVGVAVLEGEAVCEPVPDAVSEGAAPVDSVADGDAVVDGELVSDCVLARVAHDHVAQRHVKRDDAVHAHGGRVRDAAVSEHVARELW